MVREGCREVEMVQRNANPDQLQAATAGPAAARAGALAAALQHLRGRRFAEAMAAAEPWVADEDGALLHALALAGTGAAEAAAPALARIARANPGHNHPLQDLLPLLAATDWVPHLRAGLRLLPDDVRLLGLLGAALAQTGPLSEAIAAFQRATALHPGDAGAWSNLGKALSAECRFTEAEAAFGAALRLRPGNAQFEVNRAAMLLKSGRLAEGWAAFRARHSLPGRPPAPPGPRLDRLEGVKNRRILLVQDEGLGDTLQFIRYARLLAARGAVVLAHLPQTLVRLIRTAPGVSAVSSGAILPRYDAWCPIMDLPALFGTTLETIPGGIPYLQADPVPLPPGRKVGVVWAGDPAGLLDRSRSMDPSALEPLRRVPGMTWVSLQYGCPAPNWMLNPMPAVTDFAGTASVVAALDAVVSVDTAVAHLAAAMGKPVLLMDRYDNCWRWLSGRDDSPWYPGLRIIRQTQPDDWSNVIAETAVYSR